MNEIFLLGMKRLLPIASGIIPFGLIMGAVSQGHGLTLFETMGMNFMVFAGASQLASLELMSNNTESFIVITTGIVINIRFIMYSTSFAPIVANLDPFKKLGISYLLTDQSYAVSINEFDRITDHKDRIIFFMGASTLMVFVWQGSTFLGYIFGNFAPPSLGVDFIIPLAFMTLVVPSLKNRKFILVALISFIASLIFHNVPYNLGLIISAGIGITLGYQLNKREKNGKI